MESLVIQQIEFCNTILLNKASELTKEELGKLKSIIRAIQPKAEILETNYCDVDFNKIISNLEKNSYKHIGSGTGRQVFWDCNSKGSA